MKIALQAPSEQIYSFRDRDEADAWWQSVIDGTDEQFVEEHLDA